MNLRCARPAPLRGLTALTPSPSCFASLLLYDIFTAQPRGTRGVVKCFAACRTGPRTRITRGTGGFKHGSSLRVISDSTGQYVWRLDKAFTDNIGSHVKQQIHSFAVE